jgi:hypothetical protein
MTIRPRALAASLVLSAALPLVASPAQPHRRPAPARRSAPAPAPSWWERLVSMWGAAGGCTDPNGKPIPCNPGPSGISTPPPSPSGGCTDPNGCP